MFMTRLKAVIIGLSLIGASASPSLAFGGVGDTVGVALVGCPAMGIPARLAAFFFKDTKNKFLTSSFWAGCIVGAGMSAVYADDGKGLADQRDLEGRATTTAHLKVIHDKVESSGATAPAAQNRSSLAQ